MDEDVDESQRDDGEPAASRDAGTRRKPLAELTDEELRVLATEARAVDEEVQELVREVYRRVLEERMVIRICLRRMYLWAPAWLLPALLDSWRARPGLQTS